MLEKERLIEAWASGLEDNAEQQLHAIGALHGVVDEKASTLPEALAQLETSDAASQSKRRRILWTLLIVALLAVAWPFSQMVRTTIYMRQFSLSYGFLIFGGSLAEIPKVDTASEEESFLLYGDQSRSRPSDQQRALWERDKTNPVFFANYASIHAYSAKDLPPDFLKITADIDPNNAWFYEYAAAVSSREVVKKEQTIHPKSPVTQADISALPYHERRSLDRKVVKQFSVVDRTAFHEVLELWRKSLQAKDYDDYSRSLHQMRYPILSRRQSIFHDLPSITYVGTQPAWQITRRNLGDVLVAALQEADFQTEEGKQLFRDVHAYTERVASHEPATLVELLIARLVLMMIYQQIDVIDTSALDPAMVDLWQRRNQQLVDYVNQIRTVYHHDDDYRQHCSLLMAASLPMIRRQALNPPPVSLEVLKPTRYAEHCSFAQVSIAGFCLLLLLFVPFHLWGKRQKLIHRITDVVWLSMPLRSLVMLVLLGVIAPIGYYIFLVTCTPLTGKQYGPAEGFIFPFYPLMTLGLILLMLPRLLVHRFVTPWQQLHAQGQRRYLTFGWIAFALLLVPLHGMPMIISVVKDFAIFATLMILCAAPAVLWLLWSMVRGLVGRHFYKKMMHGLCQRMVGVCTLSAMVMLSIAHLGLSMAESYWTKLDTMFAISAETPILEFEAEITKIAHAELLKVLGL